MPLLLVDLTFEDEDKFFPRPRKTRKGGCHGSFYSPAFGSESVETVLDEFRIELSPKYAVLLRDDLVFVHFSPRAIMANHWSAVLTLFAAKENEKEFIVGDHSLGRTGECGLG